MKIYKEYEELKRVEQIMTVLAEEGFGFIVDRIRFRKEVPLRKRILEVGKPLPPEVRLRQTLEKLGPTFVKFGQVLSVRPDLVPLRYVKELEKLQDRVNPAPFKDIKLVIEHELGKKISEVFKHIDPKPLASASIGQVHRAKLLTGQEVVAKVQRREAESVIEADINIMRYVAELLEKHVEEAKKFKPVQIVEEFAKWTHNELDYKTEARFAARFRGMFQGSREVYIPKVYDDYCTRRVLVMEYVDALPLSELDRAKKSKAEIRKIMENGLRAILTQVFIHGFFHADPHPGNILLMKNGRISFVDFGIVGYFDRELKLRSSDLFIGISEMDADRIIEALTSFDVLPKGFDKEAFKQEIMGVTSAIHETGLKNIKVSRMIEDVLDIAYKYDIMLPTSLVLFGKSIITLEGIGLRYDPEIDLMTVIRPFVEKKLARRYFFDNMRYTTSRFAKFVTELPRKTDAILDRLQTGKFEVDIGSKEVKMLSLEIDRSSNRIAYGIMIGAFVVAGSLMADIGIPIWYGLPAVTLVLYGLAVFSGLTLLASILEEKKLKRGD
ncbi:MAG TPA: AarF/UbiB family protein [Candidatus Nanoarchaeia archaeon]|nr:AarF/UbiB family protein [Candidatus Nanoarchaeia archaeon]